MGDSYQCRVGRSHRRSKPTHPEELKYDYKDDDGRQSDEPVYSESGWPVLDCPDCKKRGADHPVSWYEAGFVSGTRICPYCGSFWDLTTLAAIANEEDLDSRSVPACTWLLRRARFYRR